MDQDDYRQRRNFIIELGKALHKFGTPAFRLETHLSNVCQCLGLDGYFMFTPTILTIVLWDPVEQENHNYLIRVEPGDLDLGSLAVADQLVDDVTNNTCGLAEGLQRLAEINRRPGPGWLSNLLAFGFTSSAFAMLVTDSQLNVAVSFIAGFVSYLLMVIVSKTGKATELMDPMVATGSALFVSSVAWFLPGVNVPVVILSSIIVFIPGLSITMAMKDLAARHLSSGCARLMDGLMCMCKLYFGSVLGVAIASLVWGVNEYVPPVADLPSWKAWLAVPILSMTLTIAFRNRLQDGIWGLLAAVVAYIGSTQGELYLGAALGPFVGALAVGIYSNMFSRIANAPSLVVLLHGVVLLVPGSKTYLGLNQVVLGLAETSPPQVGGQVFMIFMSILTGLIFSNAICPSRKSL